MTTVPIMVATSAGTSAAIAAEAASRARDAECRSTLQTFHAENSTQAQRLEYAGCVERFAPTSPADALVFKILIVFAITAGVIGAVVGVLRDDLDMPIMSAFMGAFAGLVGLLCAVLVIAGVCFVVLG